MSAVLDKMKELKAQLAELEATAANEIASGKKIVMGEILDHMKENQIALNELTLYARTSGSKYSDGGKNTWSGKGKKPEWLVKALAGGKKLEDLLTKPKTEPAAPAATA